MTSVQLLASFVSLFVITAAVLDFRTKKIPNWITVPAALAGLVFHALTASGSGVLWSLAGFAVGFSLLLLPWLLGGGGMGDVKLLAALGTWLGPLMILGVFGGSAVLAALMAASVMVSGVMTQGISATRRKCLNLDHGGTLAASATPAKGRRVIPFAIPVAISTLVALALLLIKAAAQS